ncbi:hypothetical protein ACLKA6_003098 [Drosophila palustris]
MDATFKICPLGQFYQLLIIYVAFCDQAIPFIYVIMSRKSEKGYVHLFQTLKEIFPLNGNSVMTDFETAMRNAIRNVYPNLKSGGATAPSKKRVYKQRADKIADASEELEKGKITAAIFLNRMSYPGTKICQGLEDFTCVDDDQPGNCELSDDDDADDTHDPGERDPSRLPIPTAEAVRNFSPSGQNAGSRREGHRNKALYSPRQRHSQQSTAGSQIGDIPFAV